MISHTPIWKNEAYSLGASSMGYLDFSIRTEGNVTLYTGRAFNKPGDTLGTTPIYIRPFGIIADYLKNEWNFLGEAEYEQACSVSGRFLIYQGNTLKHTINVYNNWNYGAFDKEGADPVTGCLSRPITGVLPTGALSPFTLLRDDGVEYDLHNADGTLVIEATGHSINICVEASAQGDWIDSSWRYHAEPNGDRYVLYYVNALGGWDALSIHAFQCSDGITRSEMQTGDHPNGTAIDGAERVNYRNAITKRWTMHTGWLTDDQSSRMRHLLESTKVMLFDVADYLASGGTPSARPVIITNAECPRKTYKSEKGLVAYTLEVELAQQRMRR